MSPEQAVEKWNDTVEVGTAVHVRDDFQKITHSKTRSVAWVLCGSAVVMVDGIAGGYLLERVTVVV